MQWAEQSAQGPAGLLCIELAMSYQGQPAPTGQWLPLSTTTEGNCHIPLAPKAPGSLVLAISIPRQSL